MRHIALFAFFFLLSPLSLAAPAGTKKVPPAFTSAPPADREIADDFVAHIKQMQMRMWDLMAESYKISFSAYVNADVAARAEMRKKRDRLYAYASDVIEDKPPCMREHENHRFQSQPDQQRVNKAFAEFSRVVEVLFIRLDELKFGYALIDSRMPWEGNPDDACECEEDEDAPCDPGEPCGADGGVVPL